MFYMFSGFSIIFIFAWVAAAFAAIIPISGMFFGSVAMDRSFKTPILRPVGGMLGKMALGFWIVFGLAFAFAGGTQFTSFDSMTGGFSTAFVGYLILFIGSAGKMVIAPIFSANPKRSVLTAALIILSVLCVYEFYLLAPFVLVALYFSLTAKNRIEKSGIWNITHDNFTDAEIGFARLVMAREYLAPFFLLFLSAIMGSGYFSNVVPHFLVGPTGIQTGLYDSRFEFSIVALGWAVLTAGTLTFLHSFFAYFSLAGMFDSMIQNLQGAGTTQTLRGGQKSSDLQNHLDQQ